MEYNYLGNSNLKISRFTLGTMTFGADTSEQEAFRILDIAVDHGINFLDLAELYPAPLEKSHFGRTESLVGKWLQKSKNKAVFISSKVAGPEDAADWSICPWVRGDERRADQKNIRAAVEASLARLKVDCLDLVMTHWPDRETSLDEQVAAYEELIQEGKVRYWGTSNEGPNNLPILLDFCKRQKRIFPISQQMLGNLLYQRPFEELLAICNEYNLGTMIISPLSMGVLSAKYQRGFAVNDRLKNWPDRYRERFGNEKALQVASIYADLAQSFQMRPTQLALAWLLQKKLSTIVLGARTAEHLLENLQATDVKLTEEINQHLEAIYFRSQDSSLGIG